MRKVLLLILIAGFAAQAHAQKAAPVVGPALHMQLRQAEADAPVLADEERRGVIIYTDDAAALVAAGVDVQARFDGFVTARIRRGDVPRLAALPGVRRLDDPPLYPANDVASAVTGVAGLRAGLFGGRAYTGEGVLVCIIDSGIDWAHGDFRDPTNPSKSRIRSIWDQTIDPVAGESSPLSPDYGVEYTRANIEAALAGGSPLRSDDVNGHGTHVAGTVAGNGASLSPARHAGMAPGADLVIVKAGDGSFPTSNVINGMIYCDDVAAVEGKPVVVNLSLGSQFGPHDGTRAMEAVATILGTYSGRVAVFAAGNEGGENVHISGATGAGATSTIVFTIPPYTPEEGPWNDGIGFDLWFDGPGAVTARMTSPSGATFVQVVDTDDEYFSSEGAVYLYNFLDVENGDRNIYLEVNDGDETEPPAPGTWTLEITNESATGMGFHGWIGRNRFGSGEEATLVGGDALYTLGNTPHGALTVASYAHRWNWCAHNGNCYVSDDFSDDTDAISYFSSSGPTRDGRMLPHIAAPGQLVISSMSGDAGVPLGFALVAPGGQHWLMQGTSMAAPVMTGIIALLMQQDPTLDFARTLALLQATARADAFTGAVPNVRWGAGKVDAFGAMARLVDGPAAAYQVRSYHGMLETINFIEPGQSASVRFEHSLGHGGRVLGVLLHPVFWIPTAGTLDFGIFSDDGSGKPGAQMGSWLPIPPAQLEPFTWNYVSLAGLDADLHTGTDYHLVVRPSGADDNLSLLTGSSNGASRSLLESGGVWTAQLYEWGMRPIVLSADMALPVELVLFEGTRSGSVVTLRWITASETNNAGFHIELQSGEAPWQEIGFVAGHGTTSQAQRYHFETPEMAPGAYRFRLRQVDSDGAITYSGSVEMTVEADRVLALYRDGPNPSAEGLRARFTVPHSGPARLEAYDALGRRVGVLFDGAAEPGQAYRAQLPGDGLAAGLYVLRLVQSGAQQTQTVVLAR